jgi:hypothetical protein
MSPLLLVVTSLLACKPSSDSEPVPGPNPEIGGLVFDAPDEHAAVFDDFVRFSDSPWLRAGSDPTELELVVALELVDGEPGCYRVDDEGDRLIVRGADITGLQYGAAEVAEAAGHRFFHPTRSHVPEELLLDRTGFGVDHCPDMARRGLHLHTLHPIEGLYDVWEPGSAQGQERAERTIDWVAKNRGNHIQWVALADITDGDPAWSAYTTELFDYAHARGLTTALGTQLFGGANLQLAFDLEDGDELDPEGVRERLEVLMEPGPDMVSLSFGEFSGTDPQVLVDSGAVAVELMREVDPDVEVTAVVHVGNYEELQIEYQGEEMLFYFLATYLDATPWIHTVMYYNLFEDAGLAYLHEEFDEHRDYLLDALEAGEPVGYFPESAYWVAFDINVPTYLPVYVRSRFHDMDQIRERVGPGALQDHVLFSSGWEWGYWQNDIATLRMNYALPDTWEEEVHSWFTPWGDDGALLADAIIAAADRQHSALIGDRLAAYLGGRELLIDIGDDRGIVGQPDRPGFDEIQQMSPSELQEMADRVAGLASLAADLQAIVQTVPSNDDHWFTETRQGLEVTALRARFASEVFGAAVTLAEGGDAQPQLVSAAATLDEAAEIVAARHADLNWTGGDRILAQSDDNATLYQFGYLAKADDLCFWERELIQIGNEATDTPQSVPPCF